MKPACYISIFFICVCIVPGCVKKSPRPSPEIDTYSTELMHGIPADMEKVNAYLYNSYQKQTSSAYQMQFARFTSAKGNPLKTFNHYSEKHSGKGNVRPEMVAYNDFHLNFIRSDSTFFFGYNSNYLPERIIWQLINKSQDAFKITVDDRMPIINDLPEVMSISRAQQNVFSFGGMMSNYDSAIVILGPVSGPYCRKDISQNLSLSFSANDLHYFQNGSNILTFYSFRYEHIIRNGALYVLEHSVIKRINVTITN